MKSTGIIRPVDRMGRVVIPKEIRNRLGVKNFEDSFEIFTEDDKVILKKYEPKCVFCGSLTDNVEFGGHKVCLKCIGELSAQKEKGNEN